MILGYDRTQKIAGMFNLPEWWVEAVLAEYYPCREFLKGMEVWLFNFNLIGEAELQPIRSKKVVVGNVTLFHNIRKEDFVARFPLLFSGDPFFGHKAEIVPNGPVNKYYVVFPLNPIDAWDPKLAFSDVAIVYDDGIFYQWRIADFYPIEGTNQGWWKSALFELGELKSINDQIQKIRNTKINRDNRTELRKELQRLYDELERVRIPIREKIWEYHLAQKAKKPTSGVSDISPPLLTTFDSLDVREDEYRVRTHLEPLLYRASLRSLKMAKEAASKRQPGFLLSNIIMEEMEASAVSILTAHSCLEAYINSIIQDYCTKESKVLSRMNVGQKWFITPRMLGSADCFDLSRRPYIDFMQLNAWRNDIAHFAHQWEKLSAVGGMTSKVGKAFATCNSQNAEKAVDTVREMIRQLSSKTRIPIPRWLNPAGMWLKDVM